MAKRFFHKTLARFVEVKPEETTITLLMFFYFFLITSSAYIIKPVKLSLFLKELSFRNLPYAYLLTALLIGIVVALNSRFLRVMKRHVYISLSLLFFITSLLIFWFLFTHGRDWFSPKQLKWIFMIFWFWVDIFLITSITQFWILINDIYTPRQAKRLVGFLVSGGLLGGIAGAFIASRLAVTITSENLLLVTPCLLSVCLVLVNVISRFIKRKKRDEVQDSRAQKKPKTGYVKSFRLLMKNRHLIFLSGIVVVAIIVTTLIDFQFNSFVEGQFTISSNGGSIVQEDAMTSFLATFFTVLQIFAYVLHISSTNWILKNFGIRIALLITPLFLLIGSVAFFFVPVFPFAVLIKASDKSLAHSLSQSVRELLYIPIHPDIKYKAKVFIDMFMNKFAKGIGALLILLFLSIFPLENRDISSVVKYLSILVVFFTVIWIILNLQVTKEYVNIVKKSLKIKWQDADKLIGEKIDVDVTKLVFDTLESKKRSSVLYAMNLFDLVKKEKMSPELKKIISYKSDEIRASSMDSLLEIDGEVLVPEIDDSLEEENLDVQVNEIMSLSVYQELMKDRIDKIIDEEGQEAEVSKMEAAKVMGMMKSSPSLIHNLSKLLRDDSLEVISYAIESAGKLKKREFVPFIIQHLSKPSTQQIAKNALIEYGNKITGTLKDYLYDSEEDNQVRKAIPDILAQIGTQRAADLLALELKRENKDVEARIIEAMYKMRSKNPQISFLKKKVISEVILKIKECYLILEEIHNFMGNKKKEFLVKDLENKLAKSLKYIFELLSLIYHQEDMIKAYQNICTGEKKAIDNSIELLENLLKREIIEVLMPLIDDIPLEDKVRKCKKMLKALEKMGPDRSV